ncbi:MAG: efflux RND transporter periplasmic adaptor subunit [Deltaproteobacteria bacterium]|nr:efflux RND transporter periplasmic adaptor subunit [Deltaproteobacteria bacterium]
MSASATLAAAAPPRRRPLRWILATVAAALVAAGALLLLRGGRATAAPEAPRAIASRRTLRSQVQATGVVRAMTGAEVKVGARISGRVERLLANVGDRVEKGAAIAHLDDRDLRARLARAQADLAAARAQLALVKRGARPEEIADAEAVVAQARAEAELAAVQERRVAPLTERGYTGQEELDRAHRDLAVARARAASADSKLALVRKRFLPEDVALALARVGQSEAAVAEAQATVSFATIEAPISGVIAQVATQEGETVSAGLNAPTFVTIIDLDRLEVAAYVDEVDVGRVKVGQKAAFSVDSFPEVEFTGRVTAIYPRAVIQSNVVNYVTTIAIDNSEGRLKPDMTANVTVALDERENVLATPDKALRREGGKTVVRVLEGAAERSQPVKVGMRGGGFAEILSGLREGDRVAMADSQPRPGAHP